jgi:prolyl-tRNA synthetase
MCELYTYTVLRARKTCVVCEARQTMSAAEKPVPVMKEIPPKGADLSAWYTQVCLKAELVSYAPVRGCVVLRPYGFALWERLQAALDVRFKETGHENAYFPLLIPESLLAREADHVEGFAPEVAWVTQGGGETLPERLAIRPTSEVIIGTMYAQWIQSYRDLPILINQWVNVMRWEKATRPFLRTLEFLWQEGHTAHATEQEAKAEAKQMLEIYREVAEGTVAVPVVVGEKSASERFAGADHTFSLEALMPDGKALQSATSHELGQNFSKAYDITFADTDQVVKHVWTTSWGMSWRMLGALIMVHGDDRGLRLPPKMAPIEILIVPIVRGLEPDVIEAAHALGRELRANGRRVRVDDRDDKKPGFKFADGEMRGIPVRIEIGARDLANGELVVVRRDRERGEEGVKVTIKRDTVIQHIPALLDEIQESLFAQAKAQLERGIVRAEEREQFLTLCRDRAGLVDIAWCDRAECEASVKAATSATTRNCRPLEEAAGEQTCIACGEPARVRAYFAQSY